MTIETCPLTEFYQNEESNIKFDFTPLLTRTPVLDFLKKQSKSLKVLDIGGGADLWTKDVVKLVVDTIQEQDIKQVINHIPISVDTSKFDFIQADITRESGWQKIREYTKINGMFDFSICSHVLEDIALPELVLEYLPQVSNMGFISCPSAHKELSPSDTGQPYKGYDHHRYFFVPGYDHQEDGELILLPKYTMVEHINFNIEYGKDKEELQIYWKNNIPHSYIFKYLEGTKLHNKPLWQVYSNLNFTA